MQFLLTAEEYNELRKEANRAKDVPKKKDLQDLCTEAANSILVKDGWYKGKVWGCIITIEKEEGNREWYCDDCPALKVCPYDYKHFSQ